jgi:L-lactate dehydrogenase
VLVPHPCDVLTVAAQKLSGLPSGRVFSSGTVLDTARLRWVLAERAGVNVAAVHAHIVGEHGDSEFALWSQARIGPIPILDWVSADGSRFDEAELIQIADDVKNAAYRIIEGKGATNYAIGISGARIVEAVLRDEGAIVPVSTVLADYHGESGVALSVPSVVDASGVARVLDVPFNDSESEAFRRSAATVRAACESLGIS